MNTEKMNLSKRVTSVLQVVSALTLIILIFKVIDISPIGRWETSVLNFRLSGYLAMFLLPLCAILFGKTRFSHYGLTFQNSTFDLHVVLSSFLPGFAVIAALHFLDWKNWIGALTLTAVLVAVTFVVLFITKTQPRHNTSATKSFLLLFLLIVAGGIIQVFLGRSAMETLSSFVKFFVIAAPAEELFFRGYVQTTLNRVFSRNFSLLGVNFGWGLILSSLLFGAMHVFNSFNPLSDAYELSLPWGLWTAFLGLFLGLVREKTNGLLAPTLLHAIINFF